MHEKVIFEYSRPGRGATDQWPEEVPAATDIPEALRRKFAPLLPEVSELETVRHFTRLSQQNFSIDTHFYPLGSCTMKYNPKACNQYAMLPEFLGRHPLAPDSHSQGFLTCMYELQEMLKEVTGMQAVSLTPMAGAQGEFAGVAMIRAYHRARGDLTRNEIIVPEAAHGTNPATATMCGCIVREIPVGADGDVDVEALKGAVGPQTAGIMLTNPSTLGVFERRIEEVARIVHGAGGLLYYDGANLNAILGKVRPGDMGFDVIHMNLHKTFSTPHGGGGPGAGAVGVSARLAPFLPIPIVSQILSKEGERSYRWLTESDLPQSIGRLSAFMGNAGVLLRAYIYMRLLGREGMAQVGEFATLNANYMLARLKAAGFDAAYPQRRASHEFIVTLKKQARQLNVTAMDFAKRLLDHGFHAPTTYFPLLVPECLLIEPTETESREVLDAFVAAMAHILKEAEEEPEHVRAAPHTMPVRRLDDVRAAKQLDLTWKQTPTAPPTAPAPARVAPLDRPKPRGIDRVLRAARASWLGLVGCFREEAAFRQELALAILVIPLGLWLGHTGIERALLVAPMLLVLIVELLNSAIEATVDRIGLERHVLAGLAKDIGSAAVLMSFVLLAAVWLLVLLGR